MKEDILCEILGYDVVPVVKSNDYMEQAKRTGVRQSCADFFTLAHDSGRKPQFLLLFLAR